MLCLSLTSLPSFAEAAQSKAITFMGQTYNLNKVDKINSGNALYFAPGQQNPDHAVDEIIVNFYEQQDKGGNPITPQRLSDSMIAHAQDEGAAIVMPFKIPDPADKSRYIYFMSHYLVYPEDGNADIWLSKIFQSGNRVVGILYKHRVDGKTENAIAENAKAWLAQNAEPYGNALGQIVVPAPN